MLHATVGECVGGGVGEHVVPAAGMGVGAAVGLLVGELVGAGVGAAVGWLVGELVGAGVGALEGAAVGSHPWFALAMACQIQVLDPAFKILRNTP